MMKTVSVQFAQYATVGVANTLFGLLIIIGLQALTTWPPVAANASGFLAGMILSFLLNSRWTFAGSGHTSSAMLRFVIVVAVAYLANLAVLHGLMSIGLNIYLAQICAVATYTALSFAGCRWFAFASANVQGQK